MSQATHSEMGPSRLARRAGCPGSLRMEAGFPDVPSEYAQEGTDLHAIVADAIRSDELLCDPADRETVEWCLSVHRQLGQDYPGAELHLERKFDLSHLSLGLGTADYVLALPFERGLVLDWKFGWTAVEPAAVNIQLAAYALGAAWEMDLNQVEVAIAQPRRRTFDRHVIGRDQLDQWKARIERIHRDCQKPDAPLIPGEHCRYCRAAGGCPAVMARAASLTKVEQPDQITGETLAKYLELWQSVKAVGTALETRAYAMLSSGATIPGWALVPGRGKRAWADEPQAQVKLSEAAKALGKAEGEIWNMELCSPAQLEEKWGKAKKVRELIQPLIVTKPGNLKLEKAG